MSKTTDSPENPEIAELKEVLRRAHQTCAEWKLRAAVQTEAREDAEAEVARLKRDVVRPLVEALGTMSPINFPPSVLKAWDDGRAALAKGGEK